MDDAALAVVLVLLLAAGAGALRGLLAGGGAPASITVLAPLAESARLLRTRGPRAPVRLLLGGIAVLLAAAAQTAVLAGASVWWLGATAVLRWVAVLVLGGGRRPVRAAFAAEALLALAVAGPIVAAGSWDPATIAASQQDLWFAVAMPVALVAFLLASTADLPPLARAAEAASGRGRLLLLAGRSLLLASAAALAAPLYLGGGGATWALAALLTAVLVLAGRRLPSAGPDLLPGRWVAAILVLAALQLALTVLLTLAAR